MQEETAIHEVDRVISDLPILTTKLYRPPVTPDLIPRERLLALMERNREHPLTLISAPAGYGKSVLARTWLHACDCPSAWVSLDENDDDLITFLRYLLAALSRALPSLNLKTWALLNAPSMPNAPVVARYLLNDLAQIETPFILALDDLHSITDQAIYDLLTELLRHPARALHLVLISRTDPPLPIASLRASRKVAEIRAHDLKFTPAETAQLLRQTLQREVDEDLAGRWTEKTEGWVTGLRLAALSLRQIGQHQELHSNISSDSRFLQEYLLAEILAGLPPDHQDCLLKVSILDRFCVGLVDAVSGQGDRFFHWLENSNLFLIPLDQGHCWYRFHHLFQQMLQNLLHSQLSDQAIADLYQRASHWCAQNGLVDEAIRYALGAGDTQSAVDLVIQHRYDLMNTEQWSRLDRWLKLLPGDVAAQSPLLMSTRAHIAMYRGEDSEIIASLQGVGQLFASLTPGTVEHESVQSEMAVVNAVSAVVERQPAQAINGAQSSLKLLPQQALYLRALATGAYAIGLQMQGDLKQGAAVIRDALAEHTWPEGLQAKLMHYLCQAFEFEADLTSMLLTGRSGLQLAEKVPAPEAVSYCRYHLGVVHYLRDEFTRAEALLQAMLDDRDSSSPIYLANGGFVLALVYQGLGQTADAAQVINLLENHFLPPEDLHIQNFIKAFQVELALRQGRLEEARQQSKRVDFEGRLPIWFLFVPHLTPVKLLLAEGTAESLADASAHLAILETETRRINRKLVLMDVLALQALVYDAKEDEQAAFEKLRAALDLGEPGGFIRTFVDLGAPMASLLNRLKNQTLKEEEKKKLPTAGFAYLTRLLAAFAEDDHLKKEAVPAPARPDSQAMQMPMIDPLTRRELKVLKLLGTDLPPNEIASELVISLNTVRTHLKNIYSKLDVHNRDEAVQRARDLGLV